MDVKKLSDDELLEIILRDENPDVPGSLHQKAVIEYTARKDKKERVHQSHLLSVTEKSLNRIISLLEFIAQKPKLSVLYGALIAIFIGVAINVVTEFFLRLFKLK